jgi:hypothetical protein
MPAGVSCSWQGHPCPCKARADRRKTKDGSTLRIHHGSRGTGTGEPGGDPSYGWLNTDQSSHTVTAAHTSTTLVSVAGVRRVRIRSRGACLNRPAREETTSINNRQRSRKKLRGTWRTPQYKCLPLGMGVTRGVTFYIVPYSWVKYEQK